MKDTFYFSHDYNVRGDDKIKPLIRKYGMLGYGIWWSIIEDLYNNANALRTDYEGIAFDLRVDEIIIKNIINDFDLFQIKDGFFGSLSVQKRLEERNCKSAKAKESAFKRWNKDANALPTDSERIKIECEGNAIKERKGKEINKKKEIKEYSPEILELNEACKKYFDEKYINSKSLDCLEKLTIIDKYSINQIKQAILNARGDTFWDSNFLSPLKLRDKDKNGVKFIDKFLKIKSNGHKNNSGQSSSQRIQADSKKEYKTTW